MSGLETAIRQALERSDRTSSENRARIYQSARNALEAGLRKQDVHDPELIAQQRHRLETIIHGIEIEERTALKAVATVEAPDRMAGLRHETTPAPSVELDDAADVVPPREARLDEGSFAGDGLDGLRPDRRDNAQARIPLPEAAPARRDRAKKATVVQPKPRRSRRGRFLSFVMVATTLVAAIGTAAWWVQTSGLLKSDSQRDTSVANPPSTVQSEDFDGSAGLRTLGTQSGFSGDWVEVFTPADTAGIVNGSRVTADNVSDDGGQHLHVTSATADAEGNIKVTVPASVLAQISGKTSTVALSVRSDAGKQTQFSVECDFASLGECGRHRFTVNEEKSDMLFKVTFDRSLAPSGPGYILINSDVTGAANSLDLFALRILPGQ
ncbi:biotin transporter BioY [Pararhizobium gei]|uniref:biotin transporter BioY n=1 Tax=Pararhizobium gei TaxID=1395951 RepID=UPI0023DC8137|nr:biotin transporter BioY [Rhizobium gei]